MPPLELLKDDAGTVAEAAIDGLGREEKQHERSGGEAARGR